MDAAGPAVDGEPPRHRVLIVGGGIVGLTLAQALRKLYPTTVKATVYERDPDPLARGAGWGLTIHWALPVFLELLPQDLVDRLEETFVDPVASKAGDGNFAYYNLKTAEQRFRVPPARRIRVRRESLRGLLMEGVDVEWCKCVRTISDSPDQSSVTAHFDDSTSATGSLIIGCDGARSAVRRLLSSLEHENRQLPVGLVGVSVTYSAQQVEQIRALDPFFLHGTHSDTGAFFWFSFLDTPASRPETPDDYRCQILISWPYRAGFLGHPTPISIPGTSKDRIAFMKRVASDWAEPFRSMVTQIPGDAEAKVLTLEDWPPPLPEDGVSSWNNHGGRATLAGDAAHAMVMYRGEAANHGILDVSEFVSHLSPYLSKPPTVDRKPSTSTPSVAGEAADNQTLEGLMASYERDMVSRTHPAVLASRQACIDAHDYERINETSPLLSKRAIVVDGNAAEGATEQSS